MIGTNDKGNMKLVNVYSTAIDVYGVRTIVRGSPMAGKLLL